MCPCSFWEILYITWSVAVDNPHRHTVLQTNTDNSDQLNNNNNVVTLHCAYPSTNCTRLCTVIQCDKKHPHHMHSQSVHICFQLQQSFHQPHTYNAQPHHTIKTLPVTKVKTAYTYHFGKQHKNIVPGHYTRTCIHFHLFKSVRNENENVRNAI